MIMSSLRPCIFTEKVFSCYEKHEGLWDKWIEHGDALIERPDGTMHICPFDLIQFTDK